MRRVRLAAAVGAAAVAIACVGLTPARAATATFDPYSIVLQRGVLGGDAATTKSAALMAQAKAGNAPFKPVSITPAAKGLNTLATRGREHVASSSKFGVVIGLNKLGANAAFIAIADASAPRDYLFNLGAPDQTLKIQPDGSVDVLDASGTLINFVQRPCAVDATGKQLPTSFSVKGNVLTQRVDTAGARFPVVADPSLACGLGWCTLQFNKVETHNIAAAGAVGVGTLIANCARGGGVFVTVCTMASGYIIGTAIVAQTSADVWRFIR